GASVGEQVGFGEGRCVSTPPAGPTGVHRPRNIRGEGGEPVLPADSCYMRKALDDMVFPPFAHSYDAMRSVLERYRAMERAGTRLIFGHDSAQWHEDGTLALAL